MVSQVPHVSAGGQSVRLDVDGACYRVHFNHELHTLMTRFTGLPSIKLDHYLIKQQFNLCFHWGL